MTFLFYNWPDNFQSYMLFKSLNKKLALIDQKVFIPVSNFIKISNLLSLIKLSKYASIIFIYSIINPKSANITKKVFSNLQYVIEQIFC